MDEQQEPRARASSSRTEGQSEQTRGADDAAQEHVSSAPNELEPPTVELRNSTGPAAEPGSAVDPDAAAATQAVRPRPRPHAGAPIRLDQPPPAVAPAAPVRAPATEDDLLTRRDDDHDPPTRSDKPVDGGTPRRRPSTRWLIRSCVILAIAVLAATLLRVYVLAPYYIPSASMEPTLHGCPSCNDDHVLVDKLSYRMHDIHRGDVIVFHRPSTWQVSENTLIKRVVGVPGDKLQVKDGKVSVNGLLLQESYTNPTCPSSGSSSGNLAGGKVYGPVPIGDVFVMGDNRCDSSDSRMFGPVPDTKVVGRAFVIFWPLGRIHFL